ncbi:hypothetical protein Q7P37_000880 [Cladosporium fusiforme]
MASQKPVKIVLGAGHIGDKIVGHDLDEYLSDFRKHGHVEIDSAATYPIHNWGESERLLGQNGVKWAQVSTKLSGMGERAHAREKIQAAIDASLENLNGHEIDVYYFHLPESVTPIEEQLEAIDKAYRAGKFKRFGISNFSPKQVEEIVAAAEKHGWVKPSVLQGQYNCFGRKGEAELLPLLRKHGIAYYAYSPAAAGVLTGKVNRETPNGSDSRWSKDHIAGQIYSASYLNDPILAASQKIREVADKHGINGHEAGLRWCIHHSALSNEYGDAVIIGASSVAQLKDNMEICDAGPLPEEVVRTIDGVWPSVKDVAPWAWIQASKPINSVGEIGGNIDELGIKQ